MRLKKVQLAILSLLAVFVLGLAVYVVRDSAATRLEVGTLDAETCRVRKALDKARDQARKVVRETIRREEAEIARDDAERAAKMRRAAKGRRIRVRRFFGSGGFTATSSYRQSVAMPKEDPSEADQEIIDVAGEAVSEADLDTAADVLEAAIKSKDPRARLAAVEMLSGLGEAGLADISEFLQDPHPDVANLAADRWELGIQDLTDEKEQAALAKVGYLAITDEDQLRSLGGTLMLVQDAKLAVDVLTEVIRDGASVQRAAAREAYESVTGEKWVDEKTAADWLEKNYEPPEPEETEPEETEPDGQESDDSESESEGEDEGEEGEETDGISETTTQEQENESD